MGPGAKHRQEGCRESGVGGGDGVSGMGLRRCGTGTRRGLRAGRDLGRPELGRGYRLPMRETPGSGVSARECQGVEDQTGPLGSGIRDLGTVLRLRPVARNDPPPHRPLFLTGQQASRPVWRRSVPSRALQLPGAKRSRALNPQRPDRPGPDPLPASSTSASASSGTPPRPPRASQPGRAPGSLRRASRDW